MLPTTTRFRLMLIVDPARHPHALTLIPQLIEEAKPYHLAIQLRAKDSSTQEQWQWARQLRDRIPKHGTLLINERVDLALAVEANGVQLPETGFPIEEARRLLPSAWMIGASRHDQAGLRRAAESGADYALLSPVGDVPGKNPALGLAAFGAIARQSSLPVVALGGITAKNSAAIIREGAAALAVQRYVFDAPDPEQRLHRLFASLPEAES